MMNPETLLITSLCLAAIPLLIAVGTCYLKFSIVLSLMRSGFGTQQAPSGALVMALSLVMSLVVMQPVINQTYQHLSGKDLLRESSRTFEHVIPVVFAASKPWREFLTAHSGERELSVFRRFAGDIAQDNSPSEPSLITLLASFVLTEIKKAFTLSFFLLIPFFVIDIVVANLLVAMGLTMMSPIIVSLPVKLLLFISTDGWLLLSKNLIQAYQ